MIDIPWYLLIIVSSIFNAGTLIIEKRLVKVEHALAFSASISFSIGLLALLFIPFIQFSLTPFELALLLAYSVALALGYWMSARLFRHGSLSTGSPLYNVMPNLIVVVFGFILLGEDLPTIQYAAIAVMLAAAFLMVFESNKKRDVQSKGFYDSTIIINAIIVGFNWILLKYALDLVNPITFIFFTSLFTPLIVWLLMLRRPTSYKSETRLETRQYVKLIALLAIITLVYRILLYTAVTNIEVSAAAPLNSTLIVVMTVLAGGMLFKEHHIKRKIGLAVVMLVAAYFLVL